MGARILLVDDEPGMLKLIGMIVRDKTAHEAVATNNPLEALEIVKGGGIDLVIADLKMPGLDGSELLEAVKRHDPGTPVIIVTAFGTEEAAAETMEKGAFDFIMKPFRKEQIVLAIDRALKWAHLQRENAELRGRLAGGAGAP